MPLASCLYECEIAHSRTKPRPHFFLHRHFMMYLDLDEVASLQNRSRLFGKNWLSPYRFSESDHLPDDQNMNTLQDRVRSFVRDRGVEEQVDSIRLLTNVRFFGYVFNPVSFFFCFDAGGHSLCCLVEVGNTFGEKKAYLLRRGTNSVFRDRQQKLFYISPFTELAQDLLFDVTVPNAHIDMRIDTMDGENKVVSTSMSGTRLEFIDRNLLALTLRFPFAPARVIALIHIHALLMWLKQTPHHRKEENIERQVAVMNPHSSLRSNLKR
jgi:DUF1365 family protein